MKKLNIVVIALSVHSLSFQAIAEDKEAAPSKEDVAEQVARCYVAHQKAQSDFFKAGEAESYKPLMAELIGKDEVRVTLNRADSRFMKLVFDSESSNQNVGKMEIESQCGDIDQQLEKLQAKTPESESK
ncbi:hypothetical protein [Thalassotalea sp. Y01]|uniref:hypothetical protein n=1 Tax=Thalassotalea sp. Y01 TaxID=2729613 RepID=UPI00145C545F|nr:hypothetical protein [Thalassotalea sp. Y01]NMP16704.1 hypothetical protein [Thalassotalea sp. Y01]